MPVADDVLTYRLRIDLRGTEPPLWRQLEVVSDLFLDELHWIVQLAFGWEDCHLHEFTAGRGRNTVHYLCPLSADDGAEGVPEEEVRLDQVLVRPGNSFPTSTTSVTAGRISSSWRRSSPEHNPCRTLDAWLAIVTAQPRTAVVSADTRQCVRPANRTTS